MGDVADMMLNGTLCVGCGAVFDDMCPSEAECRAAKRERRMAASRSAFYRVNGYRVNGGSWLVAKFDGRPENTVGAAT